MWHQRGYSSIVSFFTLIDSVGIVPSSSAAQPKWFQLNQNFTIVVSALLFPLRYSLVTFTPTRDQSAIALQQKSGDSDSTCDRPVVRKSGLTVAGELHRFSDWGLWRSNWNLIWHSPSAIWKHRSNKIVSGTARSHYLTYESKTTIARLWDNNKTDILPHANDATVFDIDWGSSVHGDGLQSGVSCGGSEYQGSSSYSSQKFWHHSGVCQ